MTNTSTHHGDQPASRYDVQLFGNGERSYGRLFPHLPLAYYRPDQLDAAAALMRMPDNKVDDAAKRWNAPAAEPPPATGAENDRIPAGHTYVGQFIDHDLTFDLGSDLGRTDPGVGPMNFRTPRFDLDSVYGQGPDAQPYLYESDGATLVIDNNDLPRLGAVAVIGDPRNDENAIVAQVHLAMMQRHNEFVAAGHGFEDARRLTRWHYQWAVLHDFLPTLCGRTVYDDVLSGDGVQLLPWPYGQIMPVEFSGAAYRFGHSQVRSDYVISPNQSPRPIFGAPGEDLRGHAPIDDGRRVDWSLLLDPALTPTFKIDTELSPALFQLFGADDPAADPPELPQGIGANLAARNLRRGVVLGLPSGESILDDLITREVVDLSSYAAVGADLGDITEAIRGAFWKSVPDAPPSTPLWGWVLAEAELAAGGVTLGPVGARIVADTFVGLMHADPRSLLRAAPGWSPSKPSYGIRDLLGVG
ncbi:MAG: peroxidase family protein [Ilumatobacter fluminis]|uniref:peroxidase family protein n=1 Tax=Ilumatobacter fluminis TaxID=467091 RepID=UPI0032EF8EC6